MALLLPAATVVAIAAFHFPYHVDVLLTEEEAEKNRRFYAEAYQRPSAADDEVASPSESYYTRVAEAAAKASRIEEQVTGFVERYDLRKRPVLEVGSGRGYLQDVADDYTGLDISPSVRRFYHKKFVLGSATSLPFPDNSFDGAWSIWVLEHVPNPEQALAELRRVMRDQGVIFLFPAWSCTSWAAEGHSVRPYSDFGLFGKITKATIPIRMSPPFQAAALIPNRLLRNLAYRSGGPTRLHYRRLIPNYEIYWEPDSDAVNSIDRHEAMLWFLSRGDECLNCEGLEGSVLMTASPLVVRVHK
jgi:SAM-dependent methyltransferase